MKYQTIGKPIEKKREKTVFSLYRTQSSFFYHTTKCFRELPCTITAAWKTNRNNYIQSANHRYKFIGCLYVRWNLFNVPYLVKFESCHNTVKRRRRSRFQKKQRFELIARNIRTAIVVSVKKAWIGLKSYHQYHLFLGKQNISVNLTFQKFIAKYIFIYRQLFVERYIF